MIAQARHPGAGSGCQGCDPEVNMPTERERPFLCAGCILWIHNEAGMSDGPTKGLDLLRKRRGQTIGVLVTP